jgi:hypothetical protein
MAAISPIPKRVRDDYAPPTEDVAFTQIRRDVLRETIHHAYMGLSKRLNRKGRADELSFIRSSNKREQMNGACEDDTSRLNYSSPFTSLGPLTISGYGVVLVAGLNYKWDTRRDRQRGIHDLCLYILEEVLGIEEITALPLTIEDLLQSNFIYHTICHFITWRPNQFPDYWDSVWNLPCACWPCGTEELADVDEWIKELQGRPAKELYSASGELWKRMQIVMGYLKAGRTYEEAKRADRKPWGSDGKSTL